MVADYQASFNGLTIGAGTIYQFEVLGGLEDFDVRSSDQVLPQLWGSQAGADFVNGRSITLGVRMSMVDGGELTFERAFVPASQFAPSTLLPLVFKMLGRPEIQVMCRVRRRSHPRAMDEMPWVSHWLVQLDAPDPRLYSSSQSFAAAPAFVTGSDKLEFTLGAGANAAFDFPLSTLANRAVDFQSVAAIGRVVCVNQGNVDTYPSFTATASAGQVNTFRVTNETTGESATFVFPLTPGATVVADMAGMATGSLVAPVVTNGTPNIAAWQTPRVPLRLVPGANSLIFVVLDGPLVGTSCLIAWRDAYL